MRLCGAIRCALTERIVNGLYEVRDAQRKTVVSVIIQIFPRLRFERGRRTL